MIPDELAVYVAKLEISDSHREKSFHMYYPHSFHYLADWPHPTIGRVGYSSHHCVAVSVQTI